MADFRSIDIANTAHVSTVVSIWNGACGRDLSVSMRAVVYNTQAATGAVQAGQVAVQHGAIVGFVLCSALPRDPATSPPGLGWIDAIAVSPGEQCRGIGSALLVWAEDWLRGHECVRARLGGSLRPFSAGLPIELENEAFFRRRGFQARSGGEYVWDVARDLAEYRPETSRKNISPATIIRPAQDGDRHALLEFLRREFPNRWRFEFEEFSRGGGRLSDWLILLTGECVGGFVRITLEDSLQPMDRFFPHRLARPWGQLGPIGVAGGLRGKGYGGALLDAGLRYLKTRGVRGCVIDWTSLLDFYGKFGFKPLRQYAVLLKRL